MDALLDDLPLSSVIPLGTPSGARFVVALFSIRSSSNTITCATAIHPPIPLIMLSKNDKYVLGRPTQPPPAGPALFLYPTNDSFIPKMISFACPAVIESKICRQTNPKTVPGERNGHFDSKVQS
jgi:hypothetical protein